MRSAANVSEVAALNPDFMGFIHYPGSPRHISDMAVEVVASLPAGVTPTLVTVDMDEERIMRLVERYGFTALQLHGNEAPEMCASLRGRGLTVIKAAALKDSDSMQDIERYNGAVDYMLFDTPSAHHGGTGRKFDWALLDSYKLPIPFFLSGGIGPDDAGEVLAFAHPMLIGLDVNSRFEILPAYKDARVLSHFITQIRKS